MPMGHSNIPPSTLLKSRDQAGAMDPGGAKRQTKEEYRAAKELEEMRKAGTAPAMTDEDGKDINPHIPQFITDSPWYMGSSRTTSLLHQRPHPERLKSERLSTINDWYQRGVTTKVATKFRKGACQNCGSMTHTKRDCFERPRKIGAQYTGDDIAPDEFIQPALKLDWEGKRDRWNGYDPNDHKAVFKEYEKLEEARKQLKAEELAAAEEARLEALANGPGPSTAAEEEPKETVVMTKEEMEAEEARRAEEAAAAAAKAMAPGPSTAHGPDSEEDEDKYAEEADMPGVHIDDDSRTKITVRNLRIREDTAKYLLNLDPNSAYYDPKSRSMRENPFANKGMKPGEVRFGGENFVRYTGEVVDTNQAQLFAWDAKKRGIDVHALAEPTKLEVLKKEIEGRKVGMKDEQKTAILEKYGGAEHLDAVPKEILMGQTESYVEYSRKGEVLKGEERAIVRSRYEEDLYPNNHSAVWGSFWRDGHWAYKCCHSAVRNSYCTGDAGKAAAGTTATLPPVARSEDPPKEEADEAAKEAKDESSSSSSDSSSSSSSSSSSEDEEVKAAREEEEKSRKERDAKKRQTKRAKRARQKERAKERAKAGLPRKDEGSSSDSEDDHETKVQKAIKAQAEADRRAEAEIALGDRKRGYNRTYESAAPTEAEMEAHRLRSLHPDDPMAQYVQEKRRKQV